MDRPEPRTEREFHWLVYFAENEGRDVNGEVGDQWDGLSAAWQEAVLSLDLAEDTIEPEIVVFHEQKCAAARITDEYQYSDGRV